MSMLEKTGILYEQIIARVIEDSRERFDAEGVDKQVLGELQKVRTAAPQFPLPCLPPGCAPIAWRSSRSLVATL